MKNRLIIFTLSLLATLTPTLLMAQNSSGKLTLVANGEDFVRQGFVSKDGWKIEFDNVYVTLADVTAYQSEPPFNPGNGGEIQAKQTVTLLTAPKTIDLAKGGVDAAPITVATAEAPAGAYNALSWKVVKATEGAAKGNTMLIDGTATKDNQTINFVIKVDSTMNYKCGEFVGEDRKGIVTAGGVAELETTFHFDHIFGDADTPKEDSLNVDALGFAPIASLAKNRVVEVDMATLQQKLNSQDYQKLEDAIAGLGHVGEGHCANNT